MDSYIFEWASYFENWYLFFENAFPSSYVFVAYVGFIDRVYYEDGIIICFVKVDYNPLCAFTKKDYFTTISFDAAFLPDENGAANPNGYGMTNEDVIFIQNESVAGIGGQ